jgi:hypothetical protein
MNSSSQRDELVVAVCRDRYARACADGPSRSKTRRRDRHRPSESIVAIRPKIRFWRAPMRRQRCDHENFFIAKYCDSESVPAAFSRHQRVAMTPNTRRSLSVRIKETSAAQALPSILTNADVGRCGTFCIDMRTCCGVAGGDASHAATLLRQHFLKRDAVFLNVLVYSGGSAFRFPSARSD